MTINDCRIIELPKFLDARGNLSFAENFTQIPFEVKRTYWLYDVPGGVNRGGHAEINNEELIIALSGAFDIVVYQCLFVKFYFHCANCYNYNL